MRTKAYRSFLPNAVVFVAVVILAVQVSAQTTEPSLGPGAASAETYSGYGTAASVEGGDGVIIDLQTDDIRLDPLVPFPRVNDFFDPWFEWKKRLNNNTGLQLQFSYQVLYQATDQDVANTDAFAGRGQIQGAWTLVNRGGKNSGKLTFRLENRHTIDSEIPPSQLGFQFGSVAPTGTGFSDFGTALTELAWRQSLLDGHFKFIVGKISAISWYNTHALSSPMRGFQNTAIQSSLSKPAPGRGIGGGLAYQFSPKLTVLGGVHDANAKSADSPFDTIGDGEFLYATEVRYYPTTLAKGRWDFLKAQLWYQDALADSGTPSGYGMTIGASRLFRERYYGFLLGGISDGDATLFERDIIVGVGVALNGRVTTASDAIAFGVGWGDPANPALREQTTAEAFYRFQFAERLAITPSIQYVRNPAASRAQDEAWVFGLRARWTF